MKKFITLIAAIAMMALLTACGGSDSGSDSGAASSNAEATQTIAIEASNWKFDKEEYTAKAGEPVKISLKNKQGFHGVEIVGVGEVEAGKDQVFTLEAGEYEIVCNIMCGEGHDDMKAKLIVQ